MSEVSSCTPHELAGGAHEHVGERVIDSEMPANDGGADVMQGGRPHRCSTLLRNRNSGTTFTCAMRWTASSVSGRRSPSTVSTTSGSPGLVLFSEHPSACVTKKTNLNMKEVRQFEGYPGKREAASSVSGHESPSTVRTTSGSPGSVLFSEHASACMRDVCRVDLQFRTVSCGLCTFSQRQPSVSEQCVVSPPG